MLRRHCRHEQRPPKGDADGLAQRGQEAHVFVGEPWFPGGVGKTSGASDFTSLLDGVEHKLFDRLPDATWFYPGHGKDSTLGAERPALSRWRARGW
jgi:glyoxylase-like metal-dependent hydrolase (beta-lactamase superfamily II)